MSSQPPIMPRAAAFLSPRIQGGALLLFVGVAALITSAWSGAPFWIDANSYAECVRIGRPVAHPPGYLFFIALGRIVYGLFSCSPYVAVQIVSCGSYVASIPLLFIALRRVTAERGAALLTVVYAFSWVPVLTATVGTSHATDLLLGAALMAVVTSRGFAEGRSLALTAFFAVFALAAGVRLTTPIMWSPAALVVLWRWRDRPAAWMGAAGLAATMILLSLTTAHLMGGWTAYRALTHQMNQNNASASLLLSGPTKTAWFNAGRALLWMVLQAGALLPLSWGLIHGRNGTPGKDNTSLLAVAGAAAGVAFTLVFYLAVHPGYLTPLAAPVLVLAAHGWENLRLRGREAVGVRCAIASVVISLGLFFGLRVIRQPVNAQQAVANALLLQYSRDALHTSTFHTATEWLMIAGRSDAAPAERLEYVRRNQKPAAKP